VPAEKKAPKNSLRLRRTKRSSDPMRAREKTTNAVGFRVLYRKELADHLESIRLMIMLLLLFFVMLASLNGALSNLSDNISTSSQYNFLKIFTTSGSSTYSYAAFLGFLGPLFGIMLGFDAINNEQSEGTLNRLAAQPIYRDTIINAKFLAGATVIFVTIACLTGLMSSIGLLRTGIAPEPEVLPRILMFIVITTIYICVWLAVSIFFSVVSKHAATAALASIALWLFLTLFMSLVASGISNAVYPTSAASATTYASAMQQVQNTLHNYSLQTGLNRISPYYLYSETITMMFNPNLRSLNVVQLMEQSQNGAITSYLSFGQSLLLVWPQIVALISIAVVFFAAAYITFMKREIRA
jgi:ABC-2 type transport system permease protein